MLGSSLKSRSRRVGISIDFAAAKLNLGNRVRFVIVLLLRILSSAIHHTPNVSFANVTITRNMTNAVALSDDRARSEEHTSELQSRFDLVCRLLLEKKKKTKKQIQIYI